MGRVIHFEIHCADPERAVRFYEGLFGWSCRQWEGSEMEYWVVQTGPDGAPGINGGLFPRQGEEPRAGQPVNAYVCTVEVEDVDAATARAEDLGGAVAVEKFEVAGVGWIAYVRDPEGNLLGLMQPAAPAA